MRFFLFILLLSIFACTPRPQTGDVNWSNIQELNSKALTIGQKVKPILEDLEQKRNSINIQGRALTEQEIQFVEEVEKLMSRFGDWDQKRINLPDFEEKFEGNLNSLFKSEQASLDTIQAIQKAVQSLSQ